MERVMPVAAVLLCSLSAFAQPADPIQNWTAPPYWTPPAVSPESADQSGRSAPGAGRQALVTSPVPLPFVAIVPCRQYDSRSGSVLADNTSRTVTLIGAPCAIPSDAQAAAVNITVFNISGAGSNGVFKAGTVAPPTTASINYPPTETQRANAGVLPLGAGGTIVVQVNQGAGSVDFVVDVFGYYSPLGVVNSLNTLAGDLTLAAGANVSITPSANTLTISTPGVLTGVTAGTAISVTGGAPSPTVLIPPSGILADRIASAQVVKDVNGAKDSVTLQGSGDVSVSTAGSTITIGAPTGSMVWGAPGDTSLIGAGYTEIATQIDYWTATTTTGAPSGRINHTAVWTGSRMIVWGGWNGSVYLNDGGQYDPVANTWTATTTTAAPSVRIYHTAVWTDSRMIVWGGWNGSVPLNDGGQYDPVGNAWTLTTTTGAPSVRYLHTAVWTGSRMIVWGGFGGDYLNDGGQYDPVGNSWTATTTTAAPAARLYHTAVWTGSRMIVWGGFSGFANLNDGGQYDPGTTPGTDSWSVTTTTNAPSIREFHTAVWTGSRMIVWGGRNVTVYLNDGGQYDPGTTPGTDSWSVTTTAGAPSARSNHTAVWTNSRMIVWGGFDGGFNLLNTGGQYDPVDTWTATTTTGAPSARYGHTAVWTGSRMIVWGGVNTVYLNDGGQWGMVSAALFYTLPPCRVLDTRNVTGPLGGPSLQPGATRTFDVAASSCGIPATAKAISVNLAVTAPVGSGHLTLYPGDAVQAPLASAINFSANQTRSNNAMLLLASDGSGTINVLAGTGGTVDFILDVNGYFQ
jgi:hypothetical protein